MFVNVGGKLVKAYRAIVDNMTVAHVNPNTLRITAAAGHEVRITSGWTTTVIEIFEPDTRKPLSKYRVSGSRVDKLPIN